MRRVINPNPFSTLSTEARRLRWTDYTKDFVMIHGSSKLSPWQISKEARSEWYQYSDHFRILFLKALFEEIREEDEAPPSNYSSRPPSPPLSVDEGQSHGYLPKSNWVLDWFN